MSIIPSIKNKLIILVGLLVLMGIFFIFQSRMDSDIKPSLTVEEISTLSDFELTRRMRIDLVARTSVSDSAESSLPAELLPVSATISFEETRAAIGLAIAIPTEANRDEVVAAYTALGAISVADIIKNLNPGQEPRSGVDLALTNALTKADVQRLRLVWVREHAKAFAEH
jgi:hypothetical protein